MEQSRTVDDVYNDFKGRRSALIKALTTDVEEFYKQCDPEKQNLFLWGYPNEQWEVKPPKKKVPLDMPEPPLGINFANDRSKDWLKLVAIHSDYWLLSVAFFFGAKSGFQKSDRKRLFSMMNELPTVFEVISGLHKKQSEEKTLVSETGSTSYNTSSNTPSAKDSERVSGSEEDENWNILREGCGVCGGEGNEEGWLVCKGGCKRWFHGKCVNYRGHNLIDDCPICNPKKAMP